MFFNIQELIRSKNVSLISSQVYNEVYYQSIEPLVLPKDFYGLLVIDNQIIEFNGRHKSLELQNQNGFLQILRVRAFSQFITGLRLKYP